ncbi:hypothetical protein [Alteromonas mediterranea]|uniref:hypothetical protein n=1 Tax=Alteromonas mediterranea TaxID=314275 RepID=UPI002FE06673|tara:strand:+ start:1116 stop:1358 length:243 start_codon:yes stop_codon:yes gene_type:complete
MPNSDLEVNMGFEGFLGILAVVALFIVSAILGSDEADSQENKQLDKLDDGMGNVIADGEHMTREEAEDAQARGELYDTYL